MTTRNYWPMSMTWASAWSPRTGVRVAVTTITDEAGSAPCAEVDCACAATGVASAATAQARTERFAGRRAGGLDKQREDMEMGSRRIVPVPLPRGWAPQGTRFGDEHAYRLVGRYPGWRRRPVCPSQRRAMRVRQWMFDTSKAPSRGDPAPVRLPLRGQLRLGLAVWPQVPPDSR